MGLLTGLLFTTQNTSNPSDSFRNVSAVRRVADVVSGESL